MRHGEAEGRGDEARALTPRGADDCRRLAVYLKGEGTAWDAILCSSARRAQESAELLSAVVDVPPALEVRPELYLAGAEGLLMQLRALPDSALAVLLVVVVPHHSPRARRPVLLCVVVVVCARRRRRPR